MPGAYTKVADPPQVGALPALAERRLQYSGLAQ